MNIKKRIIDAWRIYPEADVSILEATSAKAVPSGSKLKNNQQVIVFVRNSRVTRIYVVRKGLKMTIGYKHKDASFDEMTDDDMKLCGLVPSHAHHCTTCGNFHMSMYTRPSGKSGLVCHKCFKEEQNA